MAAAAAAGTREKMTVTCACSGHVDFSFSIFVLDDHPTCPSATAITCTAAFPTAVEALVLLLSPPSPTPPDADDGSWKTLHFMHRLLLSVPQAS
ncbi:hypothetical protein MUK42_06016 [Musa troglodytarum]|uniref:Uncharacterized protein n=1 Tax=Musa troglodytarum TaxID=320322 RepID=A0A9E7K299_9LILI|nr:hypothetical protein MUK42_06016 [Musa troglodytarum]